MGFDTHLAGRLYRFTKAYIVFVCIFHLVLSSMAWSQRPGGLDTALLVSSGSYSWIDGAWELISVQSYEFNDEYLNTESVIRAMPGSDKNDRPLPDPWRQLYEYDGRGNQISIMTQRWIRGHWQNESLNRSSYDGDNNKISISYAGWLEDSWVMRSRLSYQYNAAGAEISSLQEEWDGEQWMELRKSMTEYDAFGNAVLSYTLYWKDGIWLNDLRCIREYDANGNENLTLIQEGEGEAWVDDIRILRTYDADQNMVRRLTEAYWYDKDQSWHPDLLEIYTYEPGIRQWSSEIRKVWDGNAWVDRFRSNRTFNEYNQEVLLVEQEKRTGSDWVNEYKRESSYISTMTFAKESIPAPKVYPNPASSHLIFEGGHFLSASLLVRLYDTGGRLMLEQQMSSHLDMLDVSHLPAGVYIVRINGAPTAKSISIVVNR